MRRARKRQGFTLVEILIVVIILGILATIIIPQFTSASGHARRASLVSQLQTLRTQLELYKSQHNDQIPDLVTDWSPLTGKTTVGNKTFGPYLVSAPVNPLNNYTSVADSDGSAPPNIPCGFIYDYAGGAGTGRILASDPSGMVVFH